MTLAPLRILTHGGAGSKNEYKDGTAVAAKSGLEWLCQGRPVLDSVCQAVQVLEEDGRFNAGVGSHKRADGSIQMDACIMTSTNFFGAVAVVEGFRNPIHIAKALCETDTRFLAGRGAREFALEKRCAPFPLNPPEKSGKACDTVGCVATDGKTFAAGLSTGGTGGAPSGRVGDVPLMGCGLFAGPEGAVAATGKGEAIAMNITAYRAYQMIEQGIHPESVLSTVIDWFTEDEDIGLLVVSKLGHAGGSNRSMAWAFDSSS